MHRWIILAIALLAGGTVWARPASFLGSVVALPNTVVDITSPATGEILPARETPFTVGDRVKKGEAIAEIANRYNLHDAAHLSNQNWFYLSDMLEAKYAFVEARIARERGDRFKTLGTMDAQELADLKKAEQVAMAQYELMKDKYDAQSGQRQPASLEKRKLIAPIDGQITEANFTQGQMIHEGLKLYKIVDLRQVGFTARIPESAFRPWPAGTPARIRFDDVPGIEFRGRLERILPVVEPEARTREILFRVDNLKEVLRFGMLGRIELEIE